MLHQNVNTREVIISGMAAFYAEITKTVYEKVRHVQTRTAPMTL